MKFLHFSHKDIYVKVHAALLVTRSDEKKKRQELVYANIIDIDSRVQAVFAQFYHSKKSSDVIFRLSHAPRIGEKNFDTSSWPVHIDDSPYKHLSQRENETLVSGVIVSHRVLSRGTEGLTIFAWDGDIEEKLFWALEAHYETPLLQEWVPFLYQQLSEDDLLIGLQVHDFTGAYGQLVAYDLIAESDVLDAYISKGLASGAIQLVEDDLKEAN